MNVKEDESAEQLDNQKKHLFIWSILFFIAEFQKTVLKMFLQIYKKKATEV